MKMRAGWLTLAILVIDGLGGVTGCSAHSVASPSDAAIAAIGGDRPVSVYTPPSYHPGDALPLVVLLHGYSVDGDLEELYLQLQPQADTRHFLYAHPNGTVDSQGNHFWNATDACCNLDGATVDDSTYLSTLIEQIQGVYTVDPKRIYLIGHSNGGFMSHRMACDHADQIAAIVSLAGAQWSDLTKCQPSEPVSVVEIHGTADSTIAYDGGSVAPGTTFPSAPITVRDWAMLDKCSTTPDTTGAPLDLDGVLPGNETTVTKYDSGCAKGGHAELWTIAGGMHIPTLSTTFDTDVLDYLFAHPKP